MKVPEYLAIKFKDGRYSDPHAVITVNEAFSDEDEMNDFKKKNNNPEMFYFKLIISRSD